jgi:putative tricarboxylic transport membrane protein
MNHAPLDRRQLIQLLATGTFGTLLPAVAGHALAQTTAWAPSQPINYGIGVAPGGSVDLYARGIKNTLETLKIVNGQTVVTENKPGAAGLLILQQLQRNRGNAHQLATFHTGSIAGQVTGILKADIRDYVPVAMMVEETTLVAVRADSPFKTGLDLVAALKRDPKSIKIAVAPLKGLNIHLAIVKALKVAGVDISQLTIAPFRTSGESVTALLGGHVDVISATGPTVVPMALAGKIRMIASAAPKRGTGPLAQVLTWREQGIAADYASYNGVLLAPGVDADQISFWERALKQVAAAPEWIALVEKSGNKPIFKGYVESKHYLQTEFESTQALVAELGLEAQ